MYTLGVFFGTGRTSMALLSIYRGDITTLSVDVIVNAANSSLLGGGGVDGAIHRAAGLDLLNECQTLGGCATGDAKLTKGYNLPSKFILHTVGPIWHGGGYHEAELLASCYKKCLALAESIHAESIAFPAISCGVYGYPIEKASVIAVDTVRDWTSSHAEPKEILFVCFDRQTAEQYQTILEV